MESMVSNTRQTDSRSRTMMMLIMTNKVGGHLKIEVVIRDG